MASEMIILIMCIFLIPGTYLLVFGLDPILKHKPSRKGIIQFIIGQLLLLVSAYGFYMLLN